MDIKPSTVNFTARIVFKLPKKDVKPYFVVNNVSRHTSVAHKKTKKLSKVAAFLYGLKKQTKLPSRKISNENQ